jgi:hypothetical protein
MEDNWFFSYRLIYFFLYLFLVVFEANVSIRAGHLLGRCLCSRLNLSDASLISDAMATCAFTSSYLMTYEKIQPEADFMMEPLTTRWRSLASGEPLHYCSQREI